MMKELKSEMIMLLTVMLLMASCQLRLNAQPYNHAAGIRAGYSSGISYKGFRLHKMWAIEADVMYNRNGLNITALYEHHLEPFRSKRAFIYLGGGPFGGKWDEELSFGIAAVTGFEYNLRDLPLNFGVDWKPMLSLFTLFEPDLLDFGLSIRYRFGR
jgi:hypothetical protein